MVVAISLVAVGCSRGEATPTAAPSTSTTVVVAPTDGPVTAAPTESMPVTHDGPTSSVPATAPPDSAPVLGVPGLDSDDLFCASWSQFAGSFQVVAVMAAFGEGPPERLAGLEVVASPIVTSSYESLLAAWPAELEDERDEVANTFLGPLYRRHLVAYDTLQTAGASDDQITTIAKAWLTALAARDASTPEFGIDLPEEIWQVVDAATIDFASRLVPFGVDPSLASDVSIPNTDRYLAANCPDRGSLGGREVPET